MCEILSTNIARACRRHGLVFLARYSSPGVTEETSQNPNHTKVPPCSWSCSPCVSFFSSSNSGYFRFRNISPRTSIPTRNHQMYHPATNHVANNHTMAAYTTINFNQRVKPPKDLESSRNRTTTVDLTLGSKSRPIRIWNAGNHPDKPSICSGICARLYD